jgi:hypothetical protein
MVFKQAEDIHRSGNIQILVNEVLKPNEYSIIHSVQIIQYS